MLLYLFSWLGPQWLDSEFTSNFQIDLLLFLVFLCSLEERNCPDLLFFPCDKHHNPKQYWIAKGLFHLASYSPSPREAKASIKAKFTEGLRQRSQRNAVSWLAQIPSFRTQDQLARCSFVRSELGSTISTSHLRKCSRDMPMGQPKGGMPSTEVTSSQLLTTDSNYGRYYGILICSTMRKERETRCHACAVDCWSSSSWLELFFANFCGISL